MHVVHLINSLGTGGAERSLVDTIPRLHEKGVRSTVLCLSRREEGLAAAAIDAGYDVRFLKSTALLSRIAEARKVSLSLGADLIHTSLFESDILGRLAMPNFPLITTLVNTSYEPARLVDPNVRPVRLRGAQVIDSVTARLFCNGFQAITEAVKRAAVRRLRIPPGRVVVIPRGRDRLRLGERTECRRNHARSRLGIAADQAVIVNVGRQEYQKGQETLLRAVSELRRVRPDAILLQAGRLGNASERLRAVARETGIDTAIRWLGNRDDVPDLLVAADVFAFPSVYEGLGGSVLEAMALGVPIVASDIPALREVLDGGRCGLLVESQDVGALANGLRDALVAREATARRVSAARKRFTSTYDLDMVAARQAALYRRVVEESR